VHFVTNCSALHYRYVSASDGSANMTHGVLYPCVLCIGVARGCSGCTCSSRALTKMRGNLQGKFASALPPAHKVHPQAEQESVFMTLLHGGDLEVDAVVLGRLLRVTTKKRRQLF